MGGMRLRTVALALALSCGLTTLADAAQRKPVVRRAKTVKPRKAKQANARKVKPRKASKVKPRKAPKMKPRKAPKAKSRHRVV